MITENLSTLKIHKLSKKQYNRELNAGNLDKNAIYLTPDEEIDLSAYALKSEIPSIDGLASEAYVDEKVAGIIDSAPDTLNTLNELSKALGNDENFATTVANQIGLKAEKTYVDEELDKKSDTSHKHEEYLVTSDIDGKANTSYVDSELSKKADVEHTHSKYLEADGIADNLTTESTSKVLSANQGVVIQNQITEINSKLADLMYEVIAFTSFTNNVGTIELGSTVNNVKFTWATNKTPTTLSLDGISIDKNLTSYTYNDLALKPTSVTTKTYTVSATDERGASASKNTSITFVNGVYYGVIDESATINSTTILAMSRKLQNSKSMTVTITPSSTEYIAFAFPSRLGTPTFKMGGFETTCNCTQIQFTNASGYTETYNVYTTTNTGLGKTEVVVS